MKSFAIAMLFLSSQAQAGGWISSGGEIFQDETNPWFLSNVASVNYCVTTSPSFSMPKAQVETLVTTAIHYWKTEFARAAKGALPSEVQLGTQNFVEVDCSTTNVDLSFQFGYETLSPAQVTFLADPLKYIGVAVRTDYDTIQMRGKGFVFVASDTGANAYRNNGDLVSNAWQNPQLLEYVLMHEMGHVFGFPHAGGGVMAQTFLEQILNSKLYQFLQKPRLSRINPTTSMCLTDMVTQQWFGTSPQSPCVILNQTANGGYDVFTAPSDTSPVSAQVKLGVLQPLQPNFLDIRSKPVIILNLTSDQTLFTPAQTGSRQFMNGPIMLDQGGTTTFVPANGSIAPKTAYFRISPTSIALFGTSGPQVKPVFLYNSPLAATLMMSTNSSANSAPNFTTKALINPKGANAK